MNTDRPTLANEWRYMSRSRKAFHEAGHAAVAALLGRPFRYLTLSPRDDSASAMVRGRQTRETQAWYRTPFWLKDVTVTAAGMAASKARNVVLYGAEEANLYPAAIAMEGGQGSDPEGGDLPSLRWQARVIWNTAQERDVTDLGPEFDPGWAKTPTGVEAIAAHAWRNAVHIVCANWGAVNAVALEAEASRRALHEARIKDIVAVAPPATVDVDDVGPHFWLQWSSRLVWRPAGRCRRSTTK